MSYEITAKKQPVIDQNNFCRVFEIPKYFPEGFLFGAGKPVPFQMVDWFNPMPPSMFPYPGTWTEEIKEQIIEFLRKKTYVKPDRTYLVLTMFGECFMFEK